MRNLVGRVLLVALPLLLAPGCKELAENNLYAEEIEFLSEDVHDLMGITFQTGENAFLGDAVSPDDIIEDASADNSWTVTYELPYRVRLGLGAGVGRVRLSIVEDGQPVEFPLAFQWSTSDALDVKLIYDLVYEGETIGGRPTDVGFTATLTAVRLTALEPFFVEYFIDGDCYLGETFCRLTTRLRAPGLPDELIDGFGDGAGAIDDPDVIDKLDLDIDFGGNGRYRAQGWVGCCAYFDETFSLPR